MIFHFYGLFIGLAVVVGWTVAERIEPKVNIVAPWVIGFGFLGARVWHVVDMWSYYSQNLSQVGAVWNGGMSIWGGILGGFVAFVAFVAFVIMSSRAKSRDPSTSVGMTSMLGAIVTGLPLAQAIGRIGNGINGEFVHQVWILPWWAAEAILDLMLFALLRGRTPKYRIWIYLLGYGLIRLVLQPYRL